MKNTDTIPSLPNHGMPEIGTLMFLTEDTPVGLFIAENWRRYLIVANNDGKRAICLTEWDWPMLSYRDLGSERIEYGHWLGAAKLKLTGSSFNSYHEPAPVGMITSEGLTVHVTCCMPDGSVEYVPLGMTTAEIPDDYSGYFFDG